MADAGVLYPVILNVPEGARLLPPRERVKNLSRLARRALRISAARIGAGLERLEKDAHGAPLPENGWHWSVTHKRDFVGGLAGPAPMGLDIEKIKDCAPAMFDKIAAPSEQALLDADPLQRFFRYWTAKEAVLKVEGAGLGRLSACKIKGVQDDLHVRVAFKEREWIVEHFYFDGHVAAAVQSGFSLQWTVLDENSRTEEE